MPSEIYTQPPIRGTILSKDEAGYVDHGPFGCLNCSWFEKPQSGGDVGSCKPVGGLVNKHGCCDYWNNAKAPMNAGKIGTEYVYAPGAKYTCSECRYFDNLTKRCWPVQGYISPNGSCNKWLP